MTQKRNMTVPLIRTIIAIRFEFVSLTKDEDIEEPDEAKVSRPVRAVRFYETSLYGLGD